MQNRALKLKRRRKRKREDGLVSKNLQMMPEARRDTWSDHMVSKEQYVLINIHVISFLQDLS